ncbi:MAG: translation initiation factor [Patescibacteria group bacterium]|jgi:translation initiation factor IF-1|nr:translation initiation factor [Patescibacteria group bacterium]
MIDQQHVVRGIIQEALPNTMFRVELETGVNQVAYLAGKMRLNRIKVLVGDTVEVLQDPYGGKGRIVRRI